MKKGFLKDLLRSNKTVFSFSYLRLLWGNKISTDALKSRINYYVKRGDLYHIRRGLYAKDQNYDRLEVATKIYRPSYISFESVLIPAGIVFQYYTEIFVASYLSRSVTCDGQTYTFKALKESILLNVKGIELKEHYTIASPERAFLDTIYLHVNYHFDNLDPLNWDKVYEILPIYGGNKRMSQMLESYYQAYKEDRL